MARDTRGCDVARKATWQSHASPREGLGGVSVTRTHGRGHASPRGSSGGAMLQARGLACEGPTG